MSENENNTVNLDEHKRKLRLQQDEDVLNFNERFLVLMKKHKVVRANLGQVTFELHQSAFDQDMPKEIELTQEEIAMLKKKQEEEDLYYSTK